MPFFIVRASTLAFDVKKIVRACPYWALALIAIMAFSDAGLAKTRCQALFLPQNLIGEINARLSKKPKTVRMSDLTFVKPLKNPGANSERIELHTLNSRLVLLKFVDVNQPSLQRELAWNTVLSESGVTPYFHGVIRDAHQTALVFDYVEVGVETKFQHETPKNFRINPKVLERIQFIGDYLEAQGVRNWDTLQFIISPNGKSVVLIDPAALTLSTAKSKPGFLGPDFDSPAAQAAKIIAGLRGRFRILKSEALPEN